MSDEMMRGLSPYESFKMSEIASRRSNGVSVPGLVLGSAGLLAGIGAWIFGPVIAANRAKGIEKLVDVTNDNNQRTLDRVIRALDSERTERVAQGYNITNTITDTQSGSQQGSIQAQIENSAMAQAQAQLLTQAMLGNLSENAQKVQLYSAPQPCNCPCGA